MSWEWLIVQQKRNKLNLGVAVDMFDLIMFKVILSHLVHLSQNSLQRKKRFGTIRGSVDLVVVFSVHVVAIQCNSVRMSWEWLIVQQKRNKLNLGVAVDMFDLIMFKVILSHLVHLSQNSLQRKKRFGTIRGSVDLVVVFSVHVVAIQCNCLKPEST